LLGKPLSEQQVRIHALREAGRSYREIAADLGVSAQVVGNALVLIRRKLGIRVPVGRGVGSRLAERDPERVARALDAASEPEALVKVREAMAAAGLPESVRTSLLRRLKVRYFGVVSECRNLKTSEVLDLLGKKIHLALSYMDDKVMAEASFRDLALGSTAMIEKRQLLRGEATVIISDLERKKLHEMLPALIAEGQRRGITVDGTATVVKDAA
jgi:predicted transcriptional regulator